MASQTQVAGKATITLDGSLLGYSRNGVTISETHFHAPVHGDENGGDDGPPIDVQYLGQIHRVTAVLTQFDKAILDKITAGLDGASAGVISDADIGSLFQASGKSFSLAITVSKDGAFSRTYVHAIPAAEPLEINRGTRFSEAVVSFECHRRESDGVLFT